MWSISSECPEMLGWQILFIVFSSTAAISLLSALVSSLLAAIFVRKRLSRIGKPFFSSSDECSRTGSYSETYDLASSENVIYGS